MNGLRSNSDSRTRHGKPGLASGSTFSKTGKVWGRVKSCLPSCKVSIPPLGVESSYFALRVIEELAQTIGNPPIVLPAWSLESVEDLTPGGRKAVIRLLEQDVPWPVLRLWALFLGRSGLRRKRSSTAWLGWSNSILWM